MSKTLAKQNTLGFFCMWLENQSEQAKLKANFRVKWGQYSAQLELWICVAWLQPTKEKSSKVTLFPHFFNCLSKHSASNIHVQGILIVYILTHFIRNV